MKGKKLVIIVMLLLLVVSLAAGCTILGESYSSQAEVSDAVQNVSIDVGEVGRVLDEIDRDLGS